MVRKLCTGNWLLYRSCCGDVGTTFTQAPTKRSGYELKTDKNAGPAGRVVQTRLSGLVAVSERQCGNGLSDQTCEAVQRRSELAVGKSDRFVVGRSVSDGHASGSRWKKRHGRSRKEFANKTIGIDASVRMWARLNLRNYRQELTKIHRTAKQLHYGFLINGKSCKIFSGFLQFPVTR